MKLTFWNKDVGIQHYTYDHNGIRILKSSAREVGVYEGGELIGTELEMDPYTVYVNPYFVATHYTNEVEASKHYYMGTQRIATGLINYPFVGEEDTNDPDPDPEPGGGQPESGNNTSYGATINLQAVLLAFGKTNGVDYQINDLLSMPAITAYSYDNQAAFNAAVDDVNENEIRETPCEEDPLCLCELSRHWAWVTYGIDCSDQHVMYWYHPDYLGNTEFITDLNGNPYQYFWYSPWGESLEDQHRYQSLANPPYNYYDSPYAFNAKEFDFETGNYYYGARYYNPKYSIWLSVDPLAHHYTSQSPYNYVLNNPVNLIDPTGMSAEAGETGGIKKFFQKLGNLFKGNGWVENYRPSTDEEWDQHARGERKEPVNLREVEITAPKVSQNSNSTSSRGSGISLYGSGSNGVDNWNSGLNPLFSIDFNDPFWSAFFAFGQKDLSKPGGGPETFVDGVNNLLNVYETAKESENDNSSPSANSFPDPAPVPSSKSPNPAQDTSIFVNWYDKESDTYGFKDTIMSTDEAKALLDKYGGRAINK